MELTDYARILRRRWLTILAFVIAGGIVGLLTLPSSGTSTRANNSPTSYNATTLLVADTSKSGANLDRLALLSVAGEVPQSVAKQLNTRAATGGAAEGAPKSGPAAQSVRIGDTVVKVVPDNTTDSLRITATGPSSEQTARVANLLAGHLITFTNSTAQKALDDQLSALRDTSARLDKEIDTLAGEIGAATLTNAPNLAVLKANQADAVKKKTETDAKIDQLTQQGPNNYDLTVLQPAVAVAVSSSGGFKAPASALPRIAIALFIGLILGIIFALVRERFDSSVRGHLATEDATKLPVIAEVPYMRIRRQNRFSVAVESMSSSIVAESYRRLRTSISLMWIANQHPGDGDTIPDDTTPKTIIVTSPIPADGKSTTTANLAAAFAETGKSVIVVDLDFRRQKLHKFLGANVEPALVNLGTATEPRVDINALIQDTDVPGVRFISSAPGDANPAEAVIAAKAAIAEATKVADVVLLDAPPLLLTNDTYDFIQVAAVLLLVAREGHTSRDALSRASQLLRRLEAPVLGTVLIGARDDSSRYYGYGYGYGYGGYGYGDRSGRKGLFRRKRRNDERSTQREPAAPSGNAER